MAGNINISGSTIQGTTAIGDGSSASSQGDHKISSKESGARFDELALLLRSHGVSDRDIGALHYAIKADVTSPELAHRRLGQMVQDWAKRVLGLSMYTSGQLSLGVLGNVIANALLKYYNFP